METIQGRKLYKEIRYLTRKLVNTVLYWAISYKETKKLPFENILEGQFRIIQDIIIHTG